MGLPSVFMGHQLQIKTGLGIATDAVLRRLNYRYLHHFSACWVPDYQQAPGLAGALSHPLQLPEFPLHYLGPLSRFHETGQPPGDYLLFLLSGPEPQRTLLENIFLRELEQYKGKAILVRGLPEEKNAWADRPNLQFFNHLGAKQLEEKIAGASLVIARSGYSTIMDLAVMRKKGILIPTPGQTEQEYLAKHQMESRSFLCITQSKFRLQPALALAERFPISFSSYPAGNRLDTVVKEFVSNLVPSS
jgi:UDP-N-acetylglucosamine transferase subunit ALG13